MTEEKIGEIKKQLHQGVPEGEIKERLHNEGFSRKEIDAAFKPHYYDMRSWYLFFGIVICLAGFYLYLKSGGLLIIVLGALLFVAYFYEVRRLERLKKHK